MGANAQTTVPTFVAGQVLTAEQQRQSAGTGVPVFADTTARDAAFGGTGEKVLAEGQLAYVENLSGDAQLQYYDGTSWNSLGLGGLTLISATTIGTTVSTVTVSNAFSSTYDNYKIQIVGGTSSANANLLLQLGATTTGYYAGYSRVTYSTAAASLVSDNNAANWSRAGATNTNGMGMNLDLLGPNLAKNTFVHGIYSDPATGSSGGPFGGFLNDTTAYTAFTVLTSTGTLTGGQIRVYGYKN